MPTIHSERRRAARFAARLPIQVREIGIGSTIDISASGVSFVIDRPIPPGQIIRFQLTLDDEPGGPFELQCEGVVVRMERRGESMFTAVTIEELTVDRWGGH